MYFPWQERNWQLWLQQQNRLSHAYLLNGSKGIGISEFTLEVAKGLLCQQNGLEACGQCIHCHQFDQRTHPDFFHVNVLEDKKEISVEQIRQLSEKIFSTSHQGGRKVAWVDQAEKLNLSAFNALLKTLEEPPEQTILILTTYTHRRLPATILSRCRQMDFLPPNKQTALQWLQDKLPEADAPLLKKALKINWGAPVSAKNWVDEKQFDFESAWQSDMQAIGQQKVSISEVIGKWLKHETPEVVFDYFYLYSVNLIRAALYQQKGSFQSSWLHFQKEVLQAKEAWKQNANKELVMESLCLSWLDANRLMNNPLNESYNELQRFNPGFKGDLIRGERI